VIRGLGAAVVCAAATGCLAAPGGADPDAGATGNDGDARPSGLCQPFAAAEAEGEIAGTFTTIEGVLASDLDGDGDRDLVLHGMTALGSRRIVVARMPQVGPLSYQWSMTSEGPVRVASADLLGGDGCAELVIAGTGGPSTPVSILGQELTGDTLFRSLGDRELDIDSSAGLWLVADARLGGGLPAVALATPSTLHALPPDSLLAGAAVPTVSIPDFAAIRGIAPVPAAGRTDLLLAEDGRVRWMTPVLPGGQLQFDPLRVLSIEIDPIVTAAGADLDRDGERDDLMAAGDAALGLVLDDSVDPPVVVPVDAGAPAGCPPFDGTAVGDLDGSGAGDLVAIDACSDTTSVMVTRDARVAAGPELAGTQVDGVADGSAAGFAVLDRDGDGIDEVWLFDPTGGATCWAVDQLQLVGCD
jgi:hypothetical protein